MKADNKTLTVDLSKVKYISIEEIPRKSRHFITIELPRHYNAKWVELDKESKATLRKDVLNLIGIKLKIIPNLY